ncbi:MAG TPA: tRNA (N(6)-L-threonylcarbamoyladenosine(37)-C(2))-methylthiotransferase MtaB [Tenericutes bacterium]|nr:tRNA (N(6)-L-threonylcarbamoyladenosine(37)-C(2))-methylthiotransferase MtaB [Mycoplasmatota bacterium]
MKFYIYTLGCKVNTYESNVMADILKNNGYVEINNVSEIADIYIINTCTVTNTADSKSVKVIKQAIKKNPNAIIIVVGCMAQNKLEETKKIEGVSIVIGNTNKTKIVDFIEEYKKNNNKIIDHQDISKVKFENMTLNNFNKTRAFIKIQDGCDNFCSYCVIPYTRGDVRSKDKNDVFNEIETLIMNGHKEIVLTGIHTGNYGKEFENYDFSDLLYDIVKIKGLDRLRISSIEITEINDRVLDIIKNNDILVDHMHIPLQSGSDEILINMNRKYDTSYFINKINKIREIRPDISITTDVIVGFPGETEKHFLETVNTINNIKFSKLHIFPYSKREKTKAALMPNQINDNVKKSRVKSLLDLSKKLEIDYMKKFINKEIYFIPETYKDGYIIGHTGNYLLIKVKGDESDLHNNIKVKINNIDYPYCISEKI